MALYSEAVHIPLDRRIAQSTAFTSRTGRFSSAYADRKFLYMTIQHITDATLYLGWKPVRNAKYECLVCGTTTDFRHIRRHEETNTHKRLLPHFLAQQQVQQVQAGPSNLQQEAAANVRPTFADLLKDFRNPGTTDAVPAFTADTNGSASINWDPANAADYTHQPSWLSQQTAEVSRRLLQELASDRFMLPDSDDEELEREVPQSDSGDEPENASESGMYIYNFCYSCC
jgi:hypothetical protein